MKTILVDDEHWGLERFELECGVIEDIELVGKFNRAEEALAYAKENRVDLAFLDIEMPGMNGLELSLHLKELYPDVIIIFVSAYEQYMQEAFRDKGADYYVVKPYSKEEVEAVFKRAKLLSRRLSKRIYIETFGRFSVYVDGKPLRFTSGDAKEFLALLVDRRGTALGNQEAFGLIWEDRVYSHSTAVSLHKAIRRLKDMLAELGLSDLIIQMSASEHRINTDIFDCDYYQFLDKDPAAMRKFTGEYMTEWSWGEETAGYLYELKNC